MKLIKQLFIGIVTSLLVYACSGSSVTLNRFGYESVSFPYYELPMEFKDSIKYEEKLSSYSKGLQGVKIFLDPGHGGEDRRNKSRDTMICEADINLIVALYLRNFLEEAGAEVTLSRIDDTSVSLEERSELANISGCDLFVSIHHNATSDSVNYWTNYTSTFYHGTFSSFEYEPFEHLVAKYIQRDLAYTMRNPGSLASFDGTMSDYLIYPGEGFSVLRNTLIPSVLVECSFFTNRLEEVRLSIEEFNKIEAWGIFNGLAKFYNIDIPTVSITESRSEFSGDTLKLAVYTSDGFRANSNNFNAFLDASAIPYTFNQTTGHFEITLVNLDPGEHNLKVNYANNQNIYAPPFNRKIVIK